MAQKLDEEFLIHHSQGLFQASSTWRQEEIQDRWIRSNDLYDSKFSENERKTSDVLLGQGRLFIPKTYSHIQRILVDVLDTYFFDNEEMVSITNWKTIPSKARDTTKSLINYRLNGHPINFYQEVLESSLDAIRNKVGILKVFPRFKSGKKKNYQPIIEAIPYEDVFFSPDATWKDYWKHPMIHRMAKSKDYLKRRGYKNLDNIEETLNEQLNDEIKMQRAEDQGSPFVNQIKLDEEKKVIIYEIWDFLDVDGDGLLESVSYIAAGDAGGPLVIIRDVEENDLPFQIEGEDYNRPPLVVGSAFPEPHKMYGKDLPEIVEGLQKETNAIRNQRREKEAMSIRRPLLVNRSSNVDLSSLVNRRISGITMGDDISDQSIRELPLSDTPASSFQEQAITDRDFDEATSVSPNLLGITSGEDTATGVVRGEANANKKIKQITRNLSKTLYVPALQLLLRLEQKYATDEFVDLVTARTLGWVNSDDNIPSKKIIEGDYDLKVNLGLDKQTQINRLMLLMDRSNMANQANIQMVSSGLVTPADSPFINTMKIFKQVMPLLGEKDVTEYEIEAQQPTGEAGGVASQASAPGIGGAPTLA